MQKPMQSINKIYRSLSICLWSAFISARWFEVYVNPAKPDVDPHDSEYGQVGL